LIVSLERQCLPEKYRTKVALGPGLKVAGQDSCHGLMGVITMFHFFHDMQSVSVKIEGSSSGLRA
jgi:hypothetical protein